MHWPRHIQLLRTKKQILTAKARPSIGAAKTHAHSCTAGTPNLKYKQMSTAYTATQVNHSAKRNIPAMDYCGIQFGSASQKCKNSDNGPFPFLSNTIVEGMGNDYIVAGTAPTTACYKTHLYLALFVVGIIALVAGCMTVLSPAHLQRWGRQYAQYMSGPCLKNLKIATQHNYGRYTGTT